MMPIDDVSLGDLAPEDPFEPINQTKQSSTAISSTMVLLGPGCNPPTQSHYSRQPCKIQGN
jgi:hypothetical protein